MDKVHELLNQQKPQTPFFVLGKAFFGKKDISQKDGSYTATLWMTFFNIPFYPIDTYRILNVEHDLLPKVYGVDEFILVKSVGMKFDLSQVFWTSVFIFSFIVAISFLNIYLFVEFGPAHGFGFLGTVLGLYGILLLWNHKELNRPVQTTITKLNKPVASKVEQKVESNSILEPLKIKKPFVEPIEVEPEVKTEEPVVSKPEKRSLESVIAPTVVAKANPFVEPKSVVKQFSPTAIHIELNNDEPKFELAPPSLDQQIKASKYPKNKKIVSQPQMPSFSAVPKLTKAIAESKPIAAATITQPVTLANQVKFDPNKIMEWDPTDMDMHPVKIEYPHDHMRFADWAALLVVVALLCQLVAKFYFVLYPNQVGDMRLLQNIFSSLYNLYILSMLGMVLFAFTVRNSPYLAYPLLFLSIAYFFKLDIILLNFLMTL